MASRALKKAASSVLVARSPRRTDRYASGFSLPAVLLDLASHRRAGLFELPVLLLMKFRIISWHLDF